MSWWDNEPQANPGIALGRIGGVLALRVEDTDAYVQLREVTKIRHRGVDDGRDSVKGYVEYLELPRYTVHLVKPSRPTSMRMIQGWGPDYTNAVKEMRKEERERQLETFWLVFSYPSVISGLDAHDFKPHTIRPGVRLLGEGDVMPWQGSILDGGVQVIAPSSRPPEVPLWLARAIGKPRSRKAMAAAREAYEAIQRRDNAHVIARIAATRHFEDEARAKAEEDRARAEAILIEEMAKG
jgi:hypothetical protein